VINWNTVLLYRRAFRSIGDGKREFASTGRLATWNCIEDGKEAPEGSYSLG
jgi:hypothetical protein